VDWPKILRFSLNRIGKEFTNYFNINMSRFIDRQQGIAIIVANCLAILGKISAVNDRTARYRCAQ
jgi:hypothetical protein